MNQKKNKKIWIVIAIVLILLIIAIIGVAYWIYESSLPGTREGRNSAIEIAKEQMSEEYYRDQNDYDYKIESVDEKGVYKVRLQQNGEDTKLYYFINPETEEAVFFYDQTE